MVLGRQDKQFHNGNNDLGKTPEMKKHTDQEDYLSFDRAFFADGKGMQNGHFI